MKKPAHVVEIFLQPGEYYFGEQDIRIRTVLGSCVSITMWHPRRLIGGMCHYMLPAGHDRRERTADGKYADEAFALLVGKAQEYGTALEEYEIKLFGGGNMFPARVRNGKDHVGKKNAEAGKELIERHGMRSVAEDLGGSGHRTVIFDIWSGHVWVRRFEPGMPGVCDKRE
ncbi:MAG: chemotaxis protein CheD [Sulfuricella denitrificans]|nr:chemotaxis protein CheD [Sulfuricella denitrificans]